MKALEEITRVTGVCYNTKPRGTVVEANQDRNKAEGKRLFCGDCNGGIFSFSSPLCSVHEFVVQCVNCKAVDFLDRRYWCFLANTY